jgi:hypothetical protein
VTCGGVGWAVEYDVFLGVMGPSGCARGCVAWDVFAWADGVVISTGSEVFQIAGVKAVASREVGDSRKDEAVPCFHSGSEGGGGFVPVGGLAGNVGGVVGGDVILADSCPHCIFGGDISCPVREPE